MPAAACRIPVTRPGMELTHPAMKAQSPHLDHQESPLNIVLKYPNELTLPRIHMSIQKIHRHVYGGQSTDADSVSTTKTRLMSVCKVGQMKSVTVVVQLLSCF